MLTRRRVQDRRRRTATPRSGYSLVSKLGRVEWIHLHVLHSQDALSTSAVVACILENTNGRRRTRQRKKGGRKALATQRGVTYSWPAVLTGWWHAGRKEILPREFSSQMEKSLRDLVLQTVFYHKMKTLWRRMPQGMELPMARARNTGIYTLRGYVLALFQQTCSDTRQFRGCARTLPKEVWWVEKLRVTKEDEREVKTQRQAPHAKAS